MHVMEDLSRRYPEVPLGVLLKAEILRSGVRLVRAPVGSRHYHHHDERGQKPMEPEAHLQGSVQLPDGTTVFVYHNPQSPYAILTDPDDGHLSLALGPRNEELLELTPGPRLQWAASRTQRGTPMASIFTPSLGGGCGPVAVFLLRHCEFTVAGEECRFCSWVRMGKSREMRPDVQEMRDTLAAIWQEQGSIGYLAFSGGSLFDRGREADAFIEYMEAVRSTSLPLPATVAAIQALDPADSARLRDAGFDYACYSMEVWHEALWPMVVPGKNRSVGRAAWMKCLTDAVKIFGEGRVMCNFVTGIETAVPGLFSSPEEAADSTLEGMKWCCQNGIYPKYAAWIVQGGSAFSDRATAPLDYYVRLMTGRQRLFEEFPLPVPATDCARCLTQSFEADLARLDPGRYAVGRAIHPWGESHPAAAVASA